MIFFPKWWRATILFQVNFLTWGSAGSWATEEDLGMGLSSLVVTGSPPWQTVVTYLPVRWNVDTGDKMLNIIPLGKSRIVTGVLSLGATPEDKAKLQEGAKSRYGAGMLVTEVKPKQFDLALLSGNGIVFRIRPLAEGNARAVPFSVTLNEHQLEKSLRFRGVVEWIETVQLAGVKLDLDFRALFAELEKRIQAKPSLSDDDLISLIRLSVRSGLIKVAPPDFAKDESSAVAKLIVEICASEVRQQLLQETRLEQVPTAEPTPAQASGPGHTGFSFSLKKEVHFEQMQSRLDLSSKTQLRRVAFATGEFVLP